MIMCTAVGSHDDEYDSGYVVSRFIASRNQTYIRGE